MSKKLINLPPGENTVVAPILNPAHPSPRILVVEDDAIIRKINAVVLARSGYLVDAVADGMAGWQALHVKVFDLMITDHDLPGLTGVELVKRVRLAHMFLPVILASGALPTAELAQHPWLQLAATLTKPYTAHELLATVQTAMHRRPTAPLT